MIKEVKSSIAGQRAEPRSVDTGHFLNSVGLVDKNKLQVSVTSDAEYSKYLEYGTSYIQARRHFGNSLDRNRNAILNIFSSKIKLAVKK